MISIFGASVTQQKNGYAEILATSLAEPVSIHGYGGMHLNNAAICFLDEVIQKKPSVCLIDWFSTGYTEINKQTADSIEYLILKLSEINCKVIFLFFPFKDDKPRESFYLFCKEIIDERGCECFDIRPFFSNIDKKLILRDDVHTTPYGSKFYAKILKNELNDKIDFITVPKLDSLNNHLKPKKLSVEKIFTDRIKLNGHCKIIGFLLTIGPHSGCVKIINENDFYTENIKDAWCNFNRKHFNISFELYGEACIDILQSNYSLKNKLIIHDIYFSGERLVIKNLNEGKRISYLPLKTRNFFSRLEQRLRSAKKLFLKMICK
jgi:hypothetical protein